MLQQQRQSRFCVLLALWAAAGASVSLAFSAPPVALTRRSQSQSLPMSFAATISDETSDLLGSKTIHKENYDIVNVDLDDGRDYPIYIGTGYDDEEGTSFYTLDWIHLESSCTIDLPLMIRFLTSFDSRTFASVSRQGKQGPHCYQRSHRPTLFRKICRALARGR
jgi:hypothetical protein